MRKTIDLNKTDVEKVKEYQERNGLKNFSESMRNMIRGDSKDLSDDNFALLADAIVKMDNKINILLGRTAPRSAGEVD